MNPDSTTNMPGQGGQYSLSARAMAWFRQVVTDLGKVSATPRIRWGTEFILPLLIGVILTFWIRFSGFDLKVQQMIFHAGENSWAMGNHLLWTLLYRHGTLPAGVFAILGGIGFLLSFFQNALRPWRRIFLFFYLTMVVGPGIIVNAGLKDNWGRPRPKEVIEFGGEFQFEPVLVVDSSSSGNSFPSGHASMGFYFLAGFFIFRRHRRDLARLCLMMGLFFGAVMGIARMVQGGHFFSDIVWAGLICYFTAMGLYYVLGLDRKLFEPERTTSWRVPRRLIWLGSPLILLALAGVLLATPYRTKWEAPVGNHSLEEGPFDLQLILSRGEVEILPSEILGIAMEANGLGLPTSRIKRTFLTNDKRDLPEVVYREELRGWFSDLSSKVRVSVPWDRIRRIRLHVANAEVRMEFGEGPANPLIEVIGGRGTIRVSPADQWLTIEEPEGSDRVERTNQGPPLEPEKEKSGAGYHLKISGGYNGLIKIEQDDP